MINVITHVYLINILDLADISMEQ